MSSGIYDNDSLMSVREMPWHGQGVILDKPPVSVEDAIEKSGLGWKVNQRDLAYWEPEEGDFGAYYEDVEGWQANVRSDTGDVLGVVTKRYSPVQNDEAFSFLGEIFGSEMHFETAGSLMNGRRVWVLMKIPEFVEVGGDAIGQYAFVSNSHDGKSAVMAAMTPVRIVCANTEYAALRLARGVNVPRTYTVRHIGDPLRKIEDARNVLNVTVDYYKKFKAIGDALAMEDCSKMGAKRYFAKLLPIDEDMGERAVENRVEAREKMLSIFSGETDHPETVGASPNSAWCWYNAAVEWADHYRSNERKKGRKFQVAIDDPDGFKNRAWEMSLEMAGLR